MLRSLAIPSKMIIASSRKVGGDPPSSVSVRFVLLGCSSFEDTWRFQRHSFSPHTQPPLLYTPAPPLVHSSTGPLVLAVDGVVLRQLNSLEQRKADTA